MLDKLGPFDYSKYQLSPEVEKLLRGRFKGDDAPEEGGPYKIQDTETGGFVIYEGKWWMQKRQGRGRQIWIGHGSGEPGTSPDLSHPGEIYGKYFRGTFFDDKIEGVGRMIYPDGTYYEGQWKDNKRWGKGTIVFAQTSTRKSQLLDSFHQEQESVLGTTQSYTGDFVDDLYHGQGQEIWTSGAKYVGSYSKGLREG